MKIDKITKIYFYKDYYSKWFFTFENNANILTYNILELKSK